MMTGRNQNTVLRPLRVIATVLIIAGIVLARDVLIPATMALLLTLLLEPLVKRLQKSGLNQAVAVILTVGGFIFVLISVTVLVGDQFIELSMDLPNYRENLLSKVRDLRESGQGLIGRLTGTIKELGDELGTTEPATQPPPAQAAVKAAEPVPVKVVAPDVTLPQLLPRLLNQLTVPLVVVGATLLLLVFLLLAYDDLRGRLISWAGMRRISLTTTALNEIAQRVGRFVRLQLMVNVLYGTMVGVGLWAIGVPQALLWGVMGCLIRFVPYVGPWVAGILPTLLSIAVFRGWGRPLGVIGLFVVIEGITNLILEPVFYCSGTGLSSLGVVCASVFWGWAWGPLGLLIAVPTTVCLTVIGKYLPQLSLLNQLFGTDIEVSKVGQIYQAILVGDTTALDREIDRELETQTLAELCDGLLLPALAQLKTDLSFGAIDSVHARRAIRMLEQVVATAVTFPPIDHPLRLVCLPGQSEVDGCAARLLAMSSRSNGVAAEALSSQMLTGEAVEQVSRMDAQQVAIVQVAPASLPHFKRMFNALSARLDGKMELICLLVGDPSREGEDQASFADNARIEYQFKSVVSPLAEQETISPKITPAPATRELTDIAQNALARDVAR